MVKKLLHFLLPSLVVILFFLAKLPIQKANAQSYTCNYSGACGGSLRCCVQNPVSSATMGQQTGQCMGPGLNNVYCTSPYPYRAECAYQAQSPDPSQQLACCTGLTAVSVMYPNFSITVCQNCNVSSDKPSGCSCSAGQSSTCASGYCNGSSCQNPPPPTAIPTPTPTTDPCGRTTNKPINCTCSQIGTTTQCASGYCGGGSFEVPGPLKCQNPPVPTPTTVPTNTPTPTLIPTTALPTLTPLCDPDKTGASLDKVDDLDFAWWVAELNGTRITKASDCKTDQIIDIFDFNKMRDIRWFSGVSATAP